MGRWMTDRFSRARGGLASAVAVALMGATALEGCSRPSAPETPAVEAVALEAPMADVTVKAFARAGSDREKARTVGAEKDPVSRASPQFDQALSGVLSQYYVIRKQLAADKREGVHEAAVQLGAAIEKVRQSGGSPATSLDEARKIDEQLTGLAEAAKSIVGARDIDAERVALGRMGGPLIYLVAFHFYGDIEQQPFVYYCPMKQLAWLQDVKAIGNPYYGASMLTCGERLPRG